MKNYKIYSITICIFFASVVIAAFASEKYVKEELIKFETKRGLGEDSYTLGIFSEDGILAGPTSMCIDGDGKIYILDTERRRILIFDNNGAYIKTISVSNNKRQSGTGIDVGGDGNIFVLDPFPPITDYETNLEKKGNFLLDDVLEIRAYNQEGVLKETDIFIFKRKFQMENQISFREIFVDSENSIYIGKYNKFLNIMEKKSYINNFHKVIYQTTNYDFIEARPSKNSEETIFFDENGKESREKYKNCPIKKKTDRINNELSQYIGYNFIGFDDFGNEYFKVLKKIGDQFTDVILKFDKNDELVFITEDYLSNMVHDVIRYCTIDPLGNLYYLFIDGNQAKLLKYSKIIKERP